MNRLKYVNKLLEKDDLSEYTRYVEENCLVSPPVDLKDKILNKCYGYKNSNVNTKRYNKIKFMDIMKVACFAFIITICTELFMNASYASTKPNKVKVDTERSIYKITDKLDKISKKFSDYILDFNLKGEK